MAASTDTGVDLRTRLQTWLPKLVLSPSLAIMLVFVYGFIAFTIYLSFTDSRMLPSFGWVGWDNYDRLFRIREWNTAITNLAVFATLYIGISTLIGLSLAIFLDQKIRGEGVLRPIFLYPMALSFIVTGTAWKWFLDPAIGLENTMHLWGWESFTFNWIKDREMAIYTVVIAAVWQSSGFVMAMFLAGLRGHRQRDLESGPDRWRLELEPLSPDHLAATAPRVLVGLRHPQPSRDQILRFGDRADGRRAGQCHGAACDFHVFLHLHP